MINWKYTDATNTVVFRTLENGMMESCLVSAIAEWLSEGNTPDPADPIIIPVPTTVTMAQAQLALLAAGHLDDVEAAVTQMPREAQILWRKANTVVRGDALLIQLAAFLGLDDAALDDLFTKAAAL